MVVAHKRGLLRPAGLNDKKAILRENIILKELQREQYTELEKLRYIKEVAQLGISIGDPEGAIRKHHHEQAVNSYMRVLSNVIADRDWSSYLEQSEKDEVQKDIETWESMFGQMNDPEVKKEMDKAIEWLKN